jgi:hypothetical protein
VKLSEVKQFIAAAVLEERERCAKIADKYVRGPWDHLADIGKEIRSAEPPVITIIRPETAYAHPERVNSHTIVAGQALITDKRGEEKIVDRKRTVFAAH